LLLAGFGPATSLRAGVNRRGNPSFQQVVPKMDCHAALAMTWMGQIPQGAKVFCAAFLQKSDLFLSCFLTAKNL
jgi:hypothetical protein